jgi:hypothetical protein
MLVLCNKFFISVTLFDIMVLTKTLQVIPVKESIVSTDRIWGYVVNYFGRRVPAFLQAHSAKRMLGSECAG